MCIVEINRLQEESDHATCNTHPHSLHTRVRVSNSSARLETCICTRCVVYLSLRSFCTTIISGVGKRAQSFPSPPRRHQHLYMEGEFTNTCKEPAADTDFYANNFTFRKNNNYSDNGKRTYSFIAAEYRFRTNDKNVHQITNKPRKNNSVPGANLVQKLRK